MRWLVRSLLVVVAIPVVLIGLVAGHALFFSLSGQVATYRALQSLAAGRPVPADIDLDISAMSAEIQMRSEFARLFESGVRIDGAYWDLGMVDFPSPGWAFSIDVPRKIGLVCDTYPGTMWSVRCSQLRCDREPCTFTRAAPPTNEELREACRSISLLGKLIVRSLGYPVTLEDAANDVVSWLGDVPKQQVRAVSREDLTQFHFTLGMSIRNDLGLWSGNPELACSACGGVPCHPDEASSRILEAVWDKLQ